MRAPVWVVKLRGSGSIAVDLYRTNGFDWSPSQRDARRMRYRETAEGLATLFPGSRVVRLVPRKRGGR